MKQWALIFMALCISANAFAGGEVEKAKAAFWNSKFVPNAWGKPHLPLNNAWP